ncbi:MAG: PH domain-containing protein [Myxococcota bacterium]|nr:PH domain-containing protein [Myxococcota bacterium]MDW8363075.1 PH domain-containing protein [Myxococcales bacterium]
MSAVERTLESVPDDERVLFEGRPAAIATVGQLLLVIATVGLAWIALWLRSLARRYKITTERIVIETGLLSRRLEQIDLYRIEDYVVERPFGQRLLGTGNLVVRSGDRTSPQIRIERVRTDVVALYESLRRATEADKRRRGVRLMDVTGPVG